MAGTRTRDQATALGLLAPLGALVALVLPFFLLTLASPALTREMKLAGQAAGAVLVLLGLGLGPRSRDTTQSGAGGKAGTVVAAGLVAFLVLFAGSWVAGIFRGRDPLDAVPLLAALALFGWGATRDGEQAASRALAVLVACGAATGLLATLQRFTGFLRLPVEAPEPRFLATALIGNPGDVGASLVIPALLAASALARGRNRLAAAAALAACLAGLASAATIAPLAAAASGAALLVVLDLRRRLLPAFAAAAIALALLAASGVVSRVTAKLRSGNLSTLTSQRDIGVLSALESIRSRPILGLGPGGFASDFVRARLAAEERIGRRLSHQSSSAHFDNAHCDPLTVAAEAGLPAALALATALGALLAGLAGAVRGERAGSREPSVPAEALLASLAAVLVLSLANFPVQILPVAGPFAFLAGLAFARVAGGRAPREGPGTAAGLVLLALLLLAGSGTRLVAGRALARAEAALRAALGDDGPARAALLEEALAEGRRAAALRPRSSRAHLAVGSALAARADLAGAVRATERSLLLEERAETLLNLGRLAAATGRFEEARACFLRAVWVQPTLASAVPPAGEPDLLVARTREIEAALPKGGATPPRPPLLRSR